MWHGNWSWWGWLGMSVTMLTFWGVVIWGLVAILRRGDSGKSCDTDPNAILAQRFARGEIDEDEYRRRRQVLRDDAAKTSR